ncbi:hypothetical protein SAMN05216480_10874 [Pustulibacterium marinum]|uniref:PAP2 superfamily protein n=1 Tax=Pustulibacterium marinum TaxID=1224947 RepID=A0A1I7HBZ6_9FLAO|nr:hypothetical protein [Pustulibacterium marinum]SFU57996.1 hypothetical protein SAMN05216480_10874 [Pustulibacterium marinum]
MKRIATFISYLFHPLIMPVVGVFIFYTITPLFYEFELKKIVLFSLTILTIFVPLLIALVLLKFNIIQSFKLSTAKERMPPLLINTLIIGTIIFKLMPRINTPELYFFFVGILGSNFCCLIMALFKIKASIHMTAIIGVTTFLVGLSFHYALNVTIALSFLVAISGLIASARLYLKAHNMAEIIVGIFIGLMPQLLTIQYWL